MKAVLTIKTTLAILGLIMVSDRLLLQSAYAETDILSEQTAKLTKIKKTGDVECIAPDQEIKFLSQVTFTKKGKLYTFGDETPKKLKRRDRFNRQGFYFARYRKGGTQFRVWLKLRNRKVKRFLLTETVRADAETACKFTYRA